MQEFLLGTWGSQIVTYSQLYPWRVFAVVLAAILFLDLMLRKQRRGDGGLDFGSGDGDAGGCGD